MALRMSRAPHPLPTPVVNPGSAAHFPRYLTVILSAAKDLASAHSQILRCAQDDN